MGKRDGLIRLIVDKITLAQARTVGEKEVEPIKVLQMLWRYNGEEIQGGGPLALPLIVGVLSVRNRDLVGVIPLCVVIAEKTTQSVVV